MKYANRQLKGVLRGAAQKAVSAGQPVCSAVPALAGGRAVRPHGPRRHVARSLAATLWGMWKNGSVYRPEWVGVAAAAVSAAEGSS